jgi:ferritin heavy chain
MGHGTKNLTFSSSSLNLSKEGDRKKDLKVFAASANAPTTLTGVIFEPFEEVKKEILAVPIAHNVSLARQNYQDESESAINEQIK